MREEFPLYEAKAKLSALVRMVREGKRVVITLYGEPAAELGPVTDDAGDLAARLDRLVETGAVTPARGRLADLQPVERRPGALARFLDERE